MFLAMNYKGEWGFWMDFPSSSQVYQKLIHLMIFSNLSTSLK